ncbi:MAG: hypothetical protein HC869_25675 [Rhodospirillales bacterium]|nr:hypothetical protein [Rhodospirillales bacterium]
MGGQNHQPTSHIRLIGPSALLSQRVGEGFSAVLESNNQLENAIMVAMDGLHVEPFVVCLSCGASEYLDETVMHLERSLTKVREIQLGYRHLLDAAAKEGYRGNPLVSSLRSVDLPRAFEGTLILPSLNRQAWEDVESRVSSMNILDTLAWEATQFSLLDGPTKELIGVIKEAQARLSSGGKREFIEAIECNRISLRQAYARVFSLWNYLHAMFLYSALMMTELFYRTNNLPSLLEGGSKCKRSGPSSITAG